MLRAIPVLAALCCGVAGAADPLYSAAGIVNVGDGSPGPFAPNSIVTIYGTDLAWSERALTAADIKDGSLPTDLQNGTRVYLDDIPVPLFYVGASQINILLPSRMGLGDTKIRVVRQSVAGPVVTVAVVAAAPALFSDTSGFVIAAHRDLKTNVAPDTPAHAGDIVVLWATGLGKTAANPKTGEIPVYNSEIVLKNDLRITLGGSLIAPESIYYAGLSPGSAGLYQINFALPDNVPPDPEIRVAIGAYSTPAGLKLAVR